jgi:hypothetical protein
MFGTALRTLAAGWFGVDALREVKSVKAILSNIRFAQITKSNQDLV